jgi:cytosine/creatinine deaminase
MLFSPFFFVMSSQGNRPRHVELWSIERLPRGTAMNDRELVQEALQEAQAGLREGGLPIGSVLADRSGRIVARGHNLRVQTGDPTAHAEVVCLRNAGRRRDWPELTLVSTLSPCVMCTGTALLYRIPRIIIGENRNFLGAEDLFRQRGVELRVLDDPGCIQLMSDFIRAYPDLWNEDIGK